MAVTLHERFVVDKKGRRVGVMLSMRTYRRILDQLEELEDIAAYDEAKAHKEEVIPFDQAIKEIERSRK